MAVVAFVAWRVLRAPQPTPDTGSASEAHLVAGPAPKPTAVVTFKEGCLTSECHASLANAPVQHAAMSQGACETCHAPDSGGHVFPVLAQTGGAKDGICASCHDTATHSPVQHRAMSEDGCLACHDPHGSKAKGLLRTASLGETCLQCHPRSTATELHKPYAADRCDSCHEPHGSDHRSLLTGGEGANHCRQCHADVADAVEIAPYSHCNVERGCLACHGAHGADQKHLLLAQPRDLCVTCHPTIGSTVSGAHVSHDAVLKGDQCVSCHDPHASSHPKMLRDSQMNVCLSCHAKSVTAADGRTIPAMGESLTSSPVVHGAVRHGDCSACHTMHGGEHARLLREVSPDALAGPNDVRNYALCFSCHDPTLIKAQGTTQFRNGERNLHEVHLRGDQKSRGCGSCHAAHAGSLPRLIATTVNYQGSGWAMPMKFQLTADGGSCAPGCHERLAYSRSAEGASAPNAPSRSNADNAANEEEGSAK